MKYLMILALVAIVCSAYAGPASQPTSVNVTTNPVMILPPRFVGEGFEESDATAYSASLAVTQGQIIKYTGGYWWVVSAGSLGAAGPTNTVGDITSGTATLRRIPEGRRKGLAIVNMTTANLNLSAGTTAVIGKGITLTSAGSSWTSEGVSVPQTAVYAVAASGTNSVTVLEW